MCSLAARTPVAGGEGGGDPTSEELLDAESEGTGEPVDVDIVEAVDADDDTDGLLDVTARFG